MTRTIQPDIPSAFAVGACWRESASVYRARIGTFAALSAAASLLVVLPGLVVGTGLSADGKLPPARIAAAFLEIAYQIVVMVLFSGVAVLAAFDGRNGRLAHMPAYLGWTVPRLPGALLVTVATLVCVLVGLAFLVVPGLWATVILSVALPAFWVEDRGLDALGRSRRLVKGYGWPVLGLLVVAALTAFALSFVLRFIPSLVFGFARGAQLFATPEPVEAFARAFASCLGTLFTTVASVVAYRRLVLIQDEAPPEGAA